MFLEKYVAKFGELGVDWFYPAESYDATRILATLLASCGKDSAGCMRSKILGQEWPGVSGGFKFDENGDPNPHIGIKYVENGTDYFIWESE